MSIILGSTRIITKERGICMEFLTMNKPRINERHRNFINSLLKLKIFNDRVFENVYLEATVKLDSPIQMYYRKLWNEVYLKQQKPQGIISKDNQVTIMLSISECIKYLQTITPPAMLDQLNEQLVSIDFIYDMMCFYLIHETDKGLKAYNLTTFYSVFHMEVFPTNYKPNFENIAMVRKMLKTYSDGEILGLVDACSKPVKEIMENTKYDQPKAYIQMTFHVDTEDDLHLLYDFLWRNDLEICDLHCTDIGLFVSAYATHILPPVSNMIKVIYSQLM